MGKTESESVMGFVEVKVNGQWINLMAAEIRCQLCNEPTEAQDISAKIIIRDGAPIVGSWQCKKCHAVNG